MRVALALRTSIAAAALVASVQLAVAGAPGNPGSGTSGPAVPLGADQLGQIAVKDAARAAAMPTPASVPATRPVDGKRVPVISVTSGPATATAAAAGAPAHRPLRLPTISPAIGAIPRPAWSHPDELSKRPDVAVVGSQRVTVGAAPAILPAGTAAPVTEHRP